MQAKKYKGIFVVWVLIVCQVRKYVDKTCNLISIFAQLHTLLPTWYFHICLIFPLLYLNVRNRCVLASTINEEIMFYFAYITSRSC